MDAEMPEEEEKVVESDPRRRTLREEYEKKPKYALEKSSSYGSSSQNYGARGQDGTQLRQEARENYGCVAI